MKRNISNLVYLVIFFFANTTMMSCHNILDSLSKLLEYDNLGSWNDMVGVYNNSYDKSEYLILHNDTTYSHLYVFDNNCVKSVGTVFFYLDSTNNQSGIDYDNWVDYGNYSDYLPMGLRPVTIVNNSQLRYCLSDYIEYDFIKLRRSEHYLKQFNCQIESAFSSDEERKRNQTP